MQQTGSALALPRNKMIDWLVLMVALFLVATGSRRGNHDEDKIAYILTFFGFIVLLWGLGFLMPPADYMKAAPPYFKGFLFFIASVRMWMWKKGGIPYTIGTIAEVSLFVYIVMGSFM